MDSGERLEIVKVTEYKNIPDVHMNELNLKKVMKKCGSRKLVIYSIAGPLREGKSTLMNLLLQYQKMGDNWIQSNDVIVNSDDETRRFDAHTQEAGKTRGIWVWSEPILTTARDGKDVAILLFDSQGSFDLDADTSFNPFIYGLTMAISSIWMYNTKKPVTTDLEYLATYATNIAHAMSARTEFQKFLFLFRDEKSGLDSKEKVAKVLSKENETNKTIKMLFPVIEGFLFPYIGNNAHDNIPPDQKVRIKDMNPEFTKQVQKLCEFLFRYVLEI